jgi:hypothetical protein
MTFFIFAIIFHLILYSEIDFFSQKNHNFAETI